MSAVVLYVQEPIIPIPNMDIGGAVLAPILPYATAFKLLVTPITAVGIGAVPLGIQSDAEIASLKHSLF